MRKIGISLIVSLTFFCQHALYAQRLGTGATFEFLGTHFSYIPTDVIFSGYSYRAYYVDKLQINTKTYFSVAPMLVFDYSRYFITAKAAMTRFDGVVYKYAYPIANQEFITYFSKIDFQQIEVQGNLGLFLNSRSFARPYIEAGFGRAFTYVVNENVALDNKFDKIWRGRNEVSGLINLDKSYSFLSFSYGVRIDFISFYARYVARIGNFDTYFSYLALGMSASTSFGKIRRNYIYQPPE